MEEDFDKPQHVQAIHSLSAHTQHQFINKAVDSNPPTQATMSAEQYANQGEGKHVPDHVVLEKARVLDGLDHLKRIAVDLARTNDGRTNIIKALDVVMDEIDNTMQKRGRLKIGKKQGRGLDLQNILKGKRKRTGTPDVDGGKDPPIKKINKKVPESSSADSTGGTWRQRRTPNNKKKRKNGKQSGGFVKGMRVSVLTERFDFDEPGSYSDGKPDRISGTVTKVEDGWIKYLSDFDGELLWSHFSHLDTIKPKTTTEALVEIMLTLGAGEALEHAPIDQKGSWPKNFYEALTRSDWREWVGSVKKEIAGWRDNAAASEVNFADLKKGASVIPLGELFSRKRDGKYKFRQYAMGNLLRAGKDFGDTFATTVSGDGLRWFCSLACSCGMEVRGWDATTGYLQAKQRTPVYAYVPSHHHYSDLSYEKLAVFRQELRTLIDEEGPEGLKKFAAQQKRESRNQPKTVLSLDSAVYGLPDGGQSFAMLMQALHIKTCGMTQCEVDPSIYVKVKEDNNGRVMSYMIAITWTDDVRYFGSPDLIKEYEELVSSNMKCTMEGVATEFVSIEMKHDIEKGTMELLQTEYWEKAVKRFEEFLPDSGPKHRGVPLSIADMANMTEATDAEVKEAEHLPYSSLIGVIQYPSAFTKMEMRHAISILSRFRARWGIRHFMAALKALEYGYATRHKGILYTKSDNNDVMNLLTAYADSGFSAPRSQGCRLVMMNGGVISFTSKRHTTTDDSTTAAELTEMYLCSCDVEGLRSLMAEIGLFQQDPTIIYQDNMPAIQISMNRGQLAKKTRAMDMRTLSVRNKIEDRKVVPLYIQTTSMLADIGTKCLDEKQFCLLRDVINGYALQHAIVKGDEGIAMFVGMLVQMVKEFET